MARPAHAAPALLALMKGEGAPHAWTLGEMSRRLRQNDAGCDPSTIFRTVARLVEQGALVRLTDPGGRGPRYELAGAHHDHLRCRSCQRLFPIPCPLDPALSERLEHTIGHHVERHELVLEGLCVRCRRSRPQSSPSPTPRRKRRTAAPPNPASDSGTGSCS
ncbi:MAG: transcriptional repressor [Gammaproteobacteria bacterium]|nr:transcriptional repressor [Gammaproteobacteria bacterium]